MSRILKRMISLYGPTTKNVAVEVLGDASATSSGASPPESQGAAPPQITRVEEVATSSVIPQEQLPPRPEFPKYRIMKDRGEQRKETSLPPTMSSGGEKKSTESTTLVARKRMRAQTTEAAAGGGDDEIVDFTVGRESEAPTDDATSKPAVEEKGDDEVEKDMAAAEAKDDEPPKPKKQKRLKKNGAPVTTGTEMVTVEKETIVATGIELVLPPLSHAEADEQAMKAKEKGKGVEEPTRVNLLSPSFQLPPLILPPSLQPIDPETAQQISPQTLSFSSPKWRIMPHHSVILPGADKNNKEALRLEWTRDAMMTKDVDVAINIPDEELSHHMTAAVVKANTLWTEVVRRREEREKKVNNFISSSDALKVSMQKALEHALQRALDAEEREKKAQAEVEAEHSKRQLTAMENNFVKAQKEVVECRDKVERFASVLKEKDAKIASLIDDVKQLKKKYEVLEKKHKAVEEENKKQKETIAMREDEVKILKESDTKLQKQFQENLLQEFRLKALIRYNRARRQDLKKSLIVYVADAEALSIDNYVKTKNYDDAIGDICHDFYVYGFKLAKM